MTAAEAPLRRVLGADAYDGIASRLARVGDELRRWADVARSTDHV